MRIVPLFIFLMVGGTGSLAAETEAITDLTLEQARQIAFAKDPRLAEAYASIEAAKAREAAAGKLPNPEAIARIESAPTSSGTASQAEYVAGVSQTIPLGRRLSAAREVEQAGVEMRRKELEAAVLNLDRSVHSAFATALFTFEVLKLQTNLGTNTRELLRITRARVEQGDAAPLDLARLEAEEAQQGLEVKEALYLQREAMHALAVVIGDFSRPIQSLAGNLEDALEISQMRAATVSLEEHPAVASMESAAEAERARLRLAKSERVPDVNLDLLYRRLQGTRENAFDAGVRVAIPVFDRRRNRVREAESEVLAAEARLEMTRNQIGYEMRARELAMQKSLERAEVLKTGVLPKLEANLKGAEARYAAGDISLSELLVVRRSAAESRLEYLEAIRSVMESWAAFVIRTTPGSR